MIIREYRDKTYLQKIVEYCDRIFDARIRFGDSYESYSSDPDYRDVICMNIFQIGEVANQITDELKEELPETPWGQMYGIRNILAHAYVKIDDKVVWETVVNDIPKLRERISEIL